MSDLLNDLAEQLAKDAILQEEIDGKEGAVEAVGKSLADTSTTFQETFLTAIRYFRAEKRARQLLPNVPAGEGAQKLLPNAAAAAPTPPPSRVAPADEDETPSAEVQETRSAQTAETEEPPLDDGEIPYADAEIVEDDTNANFASGSARVGTGGLVPKPKVNVEDAETPTVSPEVTGPRKPGR